MVGDGKHHTGFGVTAAGKREQGDKATASRWWWKWGEGGDRRAELVEEGGTLVGKEKEVERRR